MKLNLQMFAKEAVSGKEIVYFYRVYKDRATKAAVLFPLVESNENSGSKSADSTATKDGSVRVSGATEIEISSTSIMSKNDANLKDFKKAWKAGELIECWEVDLSTKTEDKKCDSTYFQGYFTDFTVSSEADGLAEVEVKFGANGDGVDGQVTLSAENEEEIQYAFADLAKVTGA